MYIKEFSKRSGTSIDTIRYYEKVGLLNSLRNENNNYRYFLEKDLKTIAMINMLKQANLKLGEIKVVLSLRNRPITPDCRTDTLKFIDEKQQQFQSQIELYQQLNGIIKKLRDLILLNEGDCNAMELIKDELNKVEVRK